MGSHYFISYSSADGQEFADELSIQLQKRAIPVWLDDNEMRSGIDWDEQITEALRSCEGLLFLMTKDSVEPNSVCKDEWTRALSYKKPVIPLRYDRDAVMPMRLGSRHYIDFTGDYKQALAQLRDDIRWRSLPEGILHNLKERLADAKRDLARAEQSQRSRIEDEIKDLIREIEAQEYSISNPEAAAEKAETRIGSGLERERQPLEPLHPKTGTKFINPPPVRAPAWFQDRHVETGMVGEFLKDPALRLMIVIGRGGVGKTAMVCRLLKALESGHLPDNEEQLDVDGILYLSPKGLRQINLAHLFSDLCKLLPGKQAELLEITYKNPQATVAAKMQALLNAFPRGRTVVLLDNFEDVVDNATGQLLDQELSDALRVLLEAQEHGIKILITTRVAPKQLQLTQPGRQTLLTLGEGLKSPYAENILRAMDADGKLGLRDASDEILALARERTQGLPRALEALQGILATDRSTTLEEVLLEAENVLPENVVEALVGEAFSRLEPQAQQVMQALATLSAPVPETAVDYLLQPFVPNINSAPILRRLVNMLFVRREGGHYHLHQVDRSYALERILKGDPSDREMVPLPFTRYALLHRAAEYFEQTRTPRDSWKSIDDLTPQLAEFEVRITGEEYDAAVSVLLDIDFDYLMLWGHARLVAQLHERLNSRITDQQLLSASLTNLGTCHFNLGNYPLAINYHEQSMAIAQEINDHSSIGPTLGNLGLCYDSLGDYPLAIEYHEQSLAIAREIGDLDGEGASLINLGSCYFSLGDYPRAIEFYRQSLDIAREIGDRTGEGNAFSGFGTCYNSLGDYPLAIEYHEQSLAIARETGDRMSEGDSLMNLGNCYYSLGDYPRAIEYYGQSLAIARDIGNRMSEGLALGNLGICYSSLGDYARDIDYQEQSLAIRLEIGDRNGEGLALGNLGLCYDSLGDYQHAIDYQEQALAISQDIGDRYGEGVSLICLGDIYTHINQLEEACKYFQDAIDIADETQDKQIQHEANFSYAQARLLTGEFTTARGAIETARIHDYPLNNAAMWTLMGIIQLREGETAESCEAFSQSLEEANVLLEKSDQNFSALDTRALALCGLTLCEDKQHMAAATDAFIAARKITKAKGVVTSVLNQFDALAQADTDGVLATLRKAAAGD
jgi:tetratricopeptide (TPR) repeat protein